MALLTVYERYLVGVITESGALITQRVENYEIQILALQLILRVAELIIYLRATIAKSGTGL